MLRGDAIGAQSPGYAGLRDLASEFGGPRPAGVRDRQQAGSRAAAARATKP